MHQLCLGRAVEGHHLSVGVHVEREARVGRRLRHAGVIGAEHGLDVQVGPHVGLPVVERLRRHGRLTCQGRGLATRPPRIRRDHYIGSRPRVRTVRILCVKTGTRRIALEVFLKRQPPQRLDGEEGHLGRAGCKIIGQDRVERERAGSREVILIHRELVWRTIVGAKDFGAT